MLSSRTARALDDPAIRAACRSVELRARPQGDSRSDKSTRISVRLRDGREFTRDRDAFRGMPDNPLDRAQLRRKFMLLTAAMGEAAAGRLFERLEHLEAQPRFSLR